MGSLAGLRALFCACAGARAYFQVSTHLYMQGLPSKQAGPEHDRRAFSDDEPRY